jgi:ribosomal protein S18 acetylase RimI-like enzyme
MGGTMIVKADKERIRDIIECLNGSTLRDMYFSDADHTLRFISNAIGHDELYFYIDDATIQGFMIIDPKGMFSVFPYLKVLAVHPSFRGRGVGSDLLGYFEDTNFANSNKVFLCVSDFNPDAKRLYERCGYSQVGTIPGLYNDRADEYPMMKRK